jgi:putative ATP-dependent endonuclease of OLD family
MTVIGGLGFPALNDRELKIVSALSPETALRGNTELFYRDPTRSHELPEVYNGLGFKNLIYMAIQVSDYHLQWLRTERDRPSCQLIFIEEPEVHLHAQVQQTFITNVRNIVTSAAAATGEDDLLPQFIVTTHSSHILDAVDFERVRYFKRCALEGEPPGEVTTLNASKVSSVRDFQPAPIVIDDTTVDPKESLRFLQRYIKITHCDLFFADAAVLVEGTVEKLLLPRMVEKTAPTLRSAYLSVLEVGGAYAYRFVELLEFLSIPYVVVTDLDSVEPSGRHRACRGDTANALSSNRTLEQVFGKRTVAELLALTPEQKERSDQDCCVVFQTAVPVTSGADTLEMIPRTFEESFAYTNFELAKGGKLNLGIPLSDALAESYQAVFAHVRSSTFKKTEFALDILAMADEWIAPAYIAHGLRWLESRLAPSLNASHPEQ